MPDCEPFEQWLEQQRERLRAKAEAAAWHCVEDSGAQQDPCGTVAWGQRALELAPTDEAALRRFMQLATSLNEVVSAQPGAHRANCPPKRNRGRRPRPRDTL